MKKLFSVVLSILMVASLAACGGSTISSTAPTSSIADSSATESNAESTTGGYTGGSYQISIGNIVSESHIQNVACVKFKEIVEAKSEGKITVDVFPNGVLGGDEAMMESVAMGTLTMAAPSTSLLGNYVESFSILAMPYLFKDVESAFAAVEGDVGELLNQKLAAANVGFYNIGFMFNGIRNMTNSKRPIEKLSDLQGLKMRCMSNQVFIDMFTNLGANATPMSFGDLYTGLQQGTVDGQENPASLIYETKFQEVQKYISTTEHVYDFCSVVINSAFYDSLDAEAKQIIDAAVKEAMDDWQMNQEVADNEEFLQKLQDEGGMELTRITAENKVEFMDAVSAMYEGAEDRFGKDVMDLIAKYR